jgi:hypothetical protein
MTRHEEESENLYILATLTMVVARCGGSVERYSGQGVAPATEPGVKVSETTPSQNHRQIIAKSSTVHKYFIFRQIIIRSDFLDFHMVKIFKL